MGKLSSFFYNFYKGKQLLSLLVGFTGRRNSFDTGFTFKGKNLLQMERLFLKHIILFNRMMCLKKSRSSRRKSNMKTPESVPIHLNAFVNAHSQIRLNILKGGC